MKKIYFLLMVCCMGFAASAQTMYQPSGTSSFTGANTYCVGAPITSPLVYRYTTCNSGSGIPVGVACEVNWYYNTTNSTVIPGATLVSGPVPFASGTSAIDSVSYTPSLSVGGNYYFFCVISWTGGSLACGSVTGSIVSPTQLVTISPPPISPAAPINVCVGYTVALSNAFPGGTWTSANPGVVSVDALTGVATGVSFGGSTITYMLGGCYVTAFMYSNDNPAPIAPAGAVNVCVSSTANLSNATPGGTWTSTFPSVATIGLTSGVVSAFSTGTTVISYIVSATGCYAVKQITVNPNPLPIVGNTNVCVGGSTLLTDPTPGGVWSSSAPIRASVGFTTGIVNGNSAGTARISYILGATGCYATMTMNVNPPPAAIGGPGEVCVANNITLTNTVSGGTWSSSDPAIATVGLTTGIVTGTGAGAVDISYTTAGCTPAVRSIMVNALPGPITGIFSTCYGQTSTLGPLATGSRWYSGDTTIATVDSIFGVVSGRSMGTTPITYKVPSGCIATVNFTVNPLGPILGWDTVCVGSQVALTNIVGGGTWVSSNPAVSSIDPASGIVDGLSAGITYIGYTLPTGCHTTLFMRVIPALPPIGGPLSICSNSEVVLSNGVAGGTWTSSNPYIAEVETATGKVSGHFADTAVISYRIFGCLATTIVTINALPEPEIGFEWFSKTLSTLPIFVSYQWYDTSDTGPVAIPGATNSNLVVANKSESYSVKVTDGNGCAAFAKWFRFPLGLEHVGGTAASVAIFPNPATSVIHIDAPTRSRFVISGMEGRALISGPVAKDVGISELPAGMYLISIYDDEGKQLAVQKLIKQ